MTSQPYRIEEMKDGLLSQPCGDGAQPILPPTAEPSAAYRPDLHKTNHWIGMIGDEPLRTPDGVIRHFRTEFSAYEAAALSAFLSEDD